MSKASLPPFNRKAMRGFVELRALNVQKEEFNVPVYGLQIPQASLGAIPLQITQASLGSIPLQITQASLRSIPLQIPQASLDAISRAARSTL